MDPKTLNKIRSVKKALSKAIGNDISFDLDELDRIPIPLLQLNHNIGGGLPKGRIIEVFGFEHSGKTTLSLEFVKAIQKHGPVLYLEPENALDPKYLEKLGINTSEDKWIYNSPTTMEDCFTVIQQFLEARAIAGFVFDSLPSAPTAYEMGKGKDSIEVAGQARVISTQLRRTVGLVKESGAIGIFINHLKQAIGAYAAPESPGGKSLKFYSSLRLKTTAGKSEYFPTDGFRTRVKVIKEKVGGEYLSISEYHIQSKTGIIKQLELFDIALKHNIIKRQGGWYKVGGKKFQGKEKMMAVIRKSKGLRAAIVKAATKQS